MQEMVREAKWELIHYTINSGYYNNNYVGARRVM